MKKLITASLMFNCLAGLNAGILPEDLSWYTPLSAEEKSFFGDSTDRISVLKKICYIEVKDVSYTWERPKNSDDPIFQAVNNHFDTYFKYSMGEIFEQIIHLNFPVLSLNEPESLILMWIIRKKLDMSPAISLNPETQTNMKHFRTSCPIMKIILERWIKNYFSILGKSTYHHMSPLGKLKQALAVFLFKTPDFLNGEGCLDYPRAIFALWNLEEPPQP